MKRQITSLRQLREWIDGVFVRADHHAGKVKEALPTLLGCIMQHAEPQSIKVRVGRRGLPANQVWLTVAGREISFSYRRKPLPRIDALDGLTVLASFDNNTKSSAISRFFESIAA